MNKLIYRGFTLAEIMIVLTVIGVLSAILLPVAFHATPDENVMKFKKANSTLATVVRELVNSDKYYSDGNLGIMANGTNVNSPTYFCRSFADVISTKSVNCSEKRNDGAYNSYLDIRQSSESWEGIQHGLEVEAQKVDEACLNLASGIGEKIVAQDDTIYYQTSPAYHFGIDMKLYNEFYNTDSGYHVSNEDIKLFQDIKDGFGFNPIYKPFCFDIDGIGKGETPFGYGIRVDGKILYGKRANEWMKKAITQGD